MYRFLLASTFLLFTISNLFAQAENGIIRGRAYDAISNEPIAFATVFIQDSDLATQTDDQGNYEFTDLKPGFYNLRCSFLGYKEANQFEIQVTNSKPALVEFAMQQNLQEIDEVTITSSAFVKTEESPVALRTIGAAEIQRNPGGNRDISKVIQALPGVTSSGSFRNDLIIRGGAPNENRFYLDDVETPNINHFATQGASGGPVGLINVDFVREVDFYSGAFPANRSNALSSVFNFKLKEGRKDRIGATATLGSSDLALTLEGPITEKANFIFSARRSYLQFLFAALELPFLPAYNDFQAKVKFKINNKNEIYFTGLGAIDDFSLNLKANETEEQQFLLDNLPVSKQWNYTNGLVYKNYQTNGFTTVVLSRNMLNNESTKYEDNIEVEDNLVQRYVSQEIENKFRAEQTQRMGNFKLNYGVNYEYARYTNSTFQRITTPQGQQVLDFESAFDMHKYGAFAQASAKLLQERLTLSAGIRADGNNYSEEMSNPLTQVSPRFSLAYAITPRLSANLNTGVYYQLPPYTTLGYRESGQLVNKDLGATYIRNTHYVAGLEYNTAANSRITLEGYYKAYDNYPFLLRDSITLANLGGDFGVIGNEASVSTAKGRTYGMEALFQQRLFKGFYGILAYTLGWSQFEDKRGEFISSSWDSRHIVSITAGKQFKKNWEVGIAFRMQSGLPLTPFDVDRSALIANWDIVGQGIRNFDLLNTDRLALQNELDIRVDKKWYFKNLSFNLFLDIQNIYGATVESPLLLLDRDAEGNAQVNPNDPSRYLLKSSSTTNGSVLPTIGIILQY